jgi:phage terminase large subunit-like protein
VSSLPPWAADNLKGRDLPFQLLDEWWRLARLPQYPVAARLRDIWLAMGGRGSGKTRLGAEWVNALVRGLPPFTSRKHGRIALVGETLGDVREVMIEGPSGILAVSRGNRPRYEPSRRRLIWDDGAVAQIFSSEDPDSLRGPQFEAAWCDEVAKWKNAETCFDMLQFGLRLGERPVQLLTTTPKPVPLIRRLVASGDVTVTRMRTADNAAHLAAGFIRAVERNYAGTRLGRQELDGELIEDREDALWMRAALETAAGRPGEAGALKRIVVAVDPPATSRRTSDACGIVVAGLADDGTAWVLHDGTMRAAKPEAWAARAVALYRRFEADGIVAEVNQGGDMVAAVIATVDAAVPVRPVRASRGKWMRAEPVAALYAQGRVRHVRRFPELEDEMCEFSRAEKSKTKTAPCGLQGGCGKP